MSYPSILPRGFFGLSRWSRAAHLLSRWLGIVVVAAVAVPTLAHGFSEEEVARTFAKFDTNGDGRIDRNEYEVYKVFAFFRPRSDAPSGANEGPIRVTFQESPLTRQAFDQLDRNGDGLLSGEEVIASDMFRFEHIDRDGNGTLDRAELSAFMKSVGR